MSLWCAPSFDATRYGIVLDTRQSVALVTNSTIEPLIVKKGFDLFAWTRQLFTSRG